MRIFGPTILIALAMQAAFAHSSQSAAQSSPAIAHPAQPAAAPAKAAAPGAQPASPPQVTSISVRDYGIFSADDQASKKPAADGISFTAVSRLHMTKKTRTIPLRKGVNFGFQYQAVGTPVGQRAKLHFVVIYPPPGLRKPGAASPIARDEYDQKVRIGVKDSFDGYSLVNDWELVPGDWTLEILSGSTQLASETFTLVKQ